MPTKRTGGFLILAAALYFLANQTQVGWIYVMVAGILALLVVNFFYARGMLSRLNIQRTCSNLADDAPSDDGVPLPNDTGLALSTFFEDDPIEVTLQFQGVGLRPAFLIHADEHCPFAPPEEQAQPVFIPNLFKGRPIQANYQTTGNRRGLFAFAPLRLHSNGPFGFFSTRRTPDVPSEILIYPYYHPLNRLRLLETRELAERQTARVGVGTQVVGAREYRAGDSLRQVHWRSTARTGKLVVKEFAEEDQPSLSVVLDLETSSNVGQGKYSTFETAIRLAASLGYYATRHDIPFRLVGASPKWQPPASPLSWWAVLNYLAKVQNDGQEPLAKVLESLSALPFCVVLISHPTAETVRGLNMVRQKGSQTLAIFITPNGTIPADLHVSNATGLKTAGVSPYNWAEVLETL
jgi:uncharacterized protein (DUF58 family)